MMFKIYLAARMTLSHDWPTSFCTLFPQNKAKLARYEKISTWLERRIEIHLKKEL